MDAEELKILIQLLRDVNQGVMDSDLAQLEIGKVNSNKLNDINCVFANLNHFWSDSDIRNKDSKYKCMQFSELEKLINHLKSGHWEKANGISFLHVSGI